MPSAARDSKGELKARRDFYGFGEEIMAGVGGRNANQKYSATGDDIRKKFATYQRDAETGLDFAQSRYYQPKHGRFTSPDEFKGGPDELFDFEDDASDNPTFYADLGNPQSLNKYHYGYNNPYRFNDPDGHCPKCWIAFEVALTVWDVVETVRTFRDPNSSRTERVVAAGGTLAGIVLPGGGYGVGGKKFVKAIEPALSTATSKATTASGGAAIKTATKLPSAGKVPNPNGKKGGPKHQKEVKKVAKEIKSRGLEPQFEHMIRTPGGQKSKRFVDVVGVDKKTGKVREMHQVGKQNKNGTRVSRERKAEEDINKAGKKTVFHPIP